jgi:DNA-binding IclR family transcriptional regulator
VKTPTEHSALTHGLEVLRLLAEADGPVTATEIAAKVGLHQSSVSRVLRSLRAAGYVRKPAYHSFGVDLGILTLGGTALRHFGFIHKVLPALQHLAEEARGLQVSLVTLWQGQLIYFARTQRGHEAILLHVGGFPLHMSSSALRLLIDQPAPAALRALAQSRLRYGWSRPTSAVPRSPSAVLAAARKLLRHDCLILDRWQSDTLVSASIRCNEAAVEAGWPLVLALSGPGQTLPQDQWLLQLANGRRAVEAALRK